MKAKRKKRKVVTAKVASKKPNIPVRYVAVDDGGTAGSWMTTNAGHGWATVARDAHLILGNSYTIYRLPSP